MIALKKVQGNLNRKLISMTIIAVTIVMGVTGCLTWYITSTSVTKEIEGNLPKVAETSATDINRFFEMRLREMEIYANSPVLGGSREEVIAYLQKEVKKSNVYDLLAVTDEHGDFYTTENKAGNIAQRDYFLRTKNNLSGQISDPIVSSTTGKSIITVTAPIIKDGKFAGMVHGAVTMAYLSQKVNAIKSGETGYAFLLAADSGLTIVHPNQEVALKVNMATDNSLPQSVRLAAQKMMYKDKGFTRYYYQGKEYYMGYAPVQNTNWVLGVNIPVNETTQLISTLNQINISTVAVIILASALLIYFLINRYVSRPLKRMENIMERVGVGNLTCRVETYANDEIGRLGKAFDQMLNEQEEMIKNITQNTLGLSADIQEVAASSEQVASSMAEFSGQTEMLVGETEQAKSAVVGASLILVQLSSLIQMSRDKADTASESAVITRRRAAEGHSAVTNLIENMDNVRANSVQIEQVVNELSSYSDKIGYIAETITGIAKQTNLLALNAAIEAARAGEHGRGFAVVAEEVRKLAVQSDHEAGQVTKLIKEISRTTLSVVNSIQDSQVSIKRGTQVACEAEQALNNIQAAVELVTKDITDIGEITSEQTATSEKIVNTIDHVAKGIEIPHATAGNLMAIAQQILAAMENIAAATTDISGHVQMLDQQANKFEVNAKGNRGAISK